MVAEYGLRGSPKAEWPCNGGCAIRNPAAMHRLRRFLASQEAIHARQTTTRRMAGVRISATTVIGLLLALLAAPAAFVDAQDRGRGAGPAGQAPPGPGRGGPGYLKLFDSNAPFDPKDLAGIWSPNGNGFGGGGRCRDCGDRGYSFEFPEFTPAGQAAFDRNIPSYGRAKDSADAKANPQEHIGRRRAQPPALGNDTYGTCNPMGMPRAILYPDPVEFIALPDRIYQHFQWGYGLRTIWMDGRKLPNPIDIDLPRWWGYATGRWQGNTLIVESTGYDPRTWIDYF